MCYAIPGKVIEINNGQIIVDYFGEKRRARNEFMDLSPGDYIYAQGGFAIQKIRETEALEILEAWKELFFKLKEVDLRISRAPEAKDGMDPAFLKIIDQAAEGKSLRDDELLKLLKTKDKAELDLLYKTANFLRQKYLENSSCVHGIIEFSNYCRNNCLYCGLRRDNKNLKRYRMTVEEILKTAEEAVNRLGFKALVLQSGEDFGYAEEMLVEIVRKIRERCSVLLFLSIGERGFETYKKLYEAGARGALLRFETSSPELYKKFRPEVKPSGRVEHLKFLTGLGYLIITGGLIGLPGQSEEDRLNDIRLTKELGAEMHSFGPFLPHPDTPLAGAPAPDINMVLKFIAVSRIFDHQAKLLVTTALETLDREEGARLGLMAGAGSMMVNLTPAPYRDLYSLYPEKSRRSVKETLDLLYSLGRVPSDLGIRS